MLKILNVLIPDRKFIDVVIKCTIMANADNHFCYCCDKSVDLVTENSGLVERITPDKFVTYVTEGGFNVITMQTFTALPPDVIVNIPDRVKVVWHSWGFDIYYRPFHKPLVNLPLYHKWTRWAMLKDWRTEFEKLRFRVASYKNRKLLQTAIHRVDYFSGILPEEYDLVKKNSFFRAEHVIYTIGYTDVSNAELNMNSGDNVLVGNSGDPTNNHIDIYRRLSSINLGKKKVYSFLSYGGNEQYIKSVLTAGKKLLGDNFCPITDFLPHEEFDGIIASCGHVIMGHERQQALGNIFAAIRNGCKIYLYNTSITYKSLTNVGVKVFSIQKDLNEEELCTDLSKKDAQKNFEGYKRLRSPNPVERLNNIYRKIETDIKEMQ